MNKEAFPDISQQTVYRYIGGAPHDGILSCGFMRKLTARKSQIDFKIPYYSCFVLLSGSGEYWDETGFRTSLTPGCVVQRLPERTHSTQVIADGKWLEFYISFGKSTFDTLVTLGILDVSSPVLYFAEAEKQISHFKKLIAQTAAASDADLGPCYLEAQQIALRLTGYMRLHEKKASVIAEACRILEHDLDKKLSLKTVSKELCIGYETFRKQFFVEMQMSPDAYRQQKRMQTAQMMLLEGQSVKSIARALGYSDTYAFSKQFKRYFGCAPTRLELSILPAHNAVNGATLTNPKDPTTV